MDFNVEGEVKVPLASGITSKTSFSVSIAFYPNYIRFFSIMLDLCLLITIVM